jgi:prepilin-type N-terminal cleavage/methylation domain-containing protein
MKGLSVHSKQRGFTLIEVGIALAIGLLIIVGVANAIQASQERATVFDLVNQVNTIGAAATEWKMNNNHLYTGMDATDALKNLGYDIDGTIGITITNNGVGYSLTLPAVGATIQGLVAEKVSDQFDEDTANAALLTAK